MTPEINYQAVEELCDEVQRQTEIIKQQAATIAQLRALLGELEEGST
jgi:hypothetical protein